ncbi:hypothetical protein QYE76_066379 [Lolium multiflorum]|uniref:Reverse transcriptase Ty1/copia-type domain-containing protein n=1 Tax=Lolium multiflorum TaxID=4521 RepID=A0AAD8WBY8_LOLMU|nr:hypothetical protein QYE76_066379 [Lolium multiflorum]
MGDTNAAPSMDTTGALTSGTAGSLALGTAPALADLTAPSSSNLAMGVASVKTHVPVVLDLAKSNYAKWRMLISVLLGKYELTSHVAVQTAAADRTPAWIREDFIVRSWLYGSISEEILDIIMAENQTAFDAYVLIRNLFLDNQMTRAVHLEAEFRALVQGDLSVTAYCHRLKALSDALRDVGQPVTDQTLVLTCLRGLNPRFSDLTSLVTMQTPLPSFLQTRSMLLLRETQLHHAAPVNQQTALYGANTGNGGAGYGQGNGNGGAGYGQGNGNGGRNRGRRGNRGNGNNNLSGAPRPPVGPWVYFNPATGAMQPVQPTWRPAAPPGGQGLLGPRPSAPPATPSHRPQTWVPPGQQAYTTVMAPLHGQAFGTNQPPPGPVYYGAPATDGAPAWDCSALMAALNNAASSSSSPAAAGEWVMDSGATSHMASNPADYSDLRVFGCLCYPNLSATAPHKLSPRSTACVFLGYPCSHHGYRCLDMSTRRVITSRHVVFDESTFPFTASPPTPSSDSLDFLLDLAANDSIPPAPLTAPRAAPPTGPAPPADPTSSVPSEHAAPPSPPTATPLTAPPSPITAHPSPTAAPTSTTTPPPPPADNIHPMTTRAKRGIHVPPRERLNLSAIETAISPIPKTYRTALHDPHWRAAMTDEFNALMQNRTWTLVPCPAGANIVSGKWLFKHKFGSDGGLARYKARWVVRGFSQQTGIDFDETFSPVVKPATIRVVLSIATSRAWPVHQLDVKNAFLHGNLDEEVYCVQPPGFVDPAHPHHVCRLHKSLYGLKQAPRAWYQRFAHYAHRLGFVASQSDVSLFVLRQGTEVAYLLLYVDDIILTASTSRLLQHITGLLHREFSMTDLGDLSYFLGISVTRSSTGMFLSQRQYALDLLQRAGMLDCNPCVTPIDTRCKLPADDGPLLADPTEYCSFAGALQYLTLTRLDIAHAVQQACLYMHAPREPHLTLVKRILRYIRGSLDYGLQLHATPSTTLTAYSDADWAGCPDTRRSTSGYCIYLGDNLVSWSSKRQATVSRSSAEAEYRAVAHAVAECCWTRQLLQELHQPLRAATIVFCDNVSAVYMSSNPVQHSRTKHIEIDIHFVREKVSLGQIRVLHVPSSQQFADIMTKGLPSQLFLDFRGDMMMNNNLNMNLGSMVSLNSIYNKYRITPGEFPLSNNQDLTRIATAMTRCSGGDGGVDGGDDDDDDGDDVPLDDDGDGVDFPSGREFPGGFRPGELFSLWCSPPRRGGCNPS